MLELKELKELHDKAYNANSVAREQAADDLVFYWVTNWDDQLLEDSQLAFRGEFNIIRKAGRQIMGDLRINPIQPDFKPKNEAREEDAELLDGMYRADDRSLCSQEAYDYATQDAVVCGYGAWELYTEYATNQIGDENQVIKRRYIPEANNNCFWDPNAVRQDKSDAMYCGTLFRYSEDGYTDLVEELTGEEATFTASSFAFPEESYSFPWVAEQNKIHVVTFYHKEKVTDKVITLSDPFGEQVIYRESQIDEVMDELVSEGYNVVSEKKIKRWKVTKYIASGSEILSSEEIAGENIPVVPMYGERSFVEGEEYWEGITRLAKDPQRLRNFQMSYLADIVSRSPRPKPIFTPEQIQGFEPMYEESGADNNYPYLLQNSKNANGEPLTMGAVAVMPEQTMPQALMASIELTRQAVEDVANPGLPQDIADPDLSGKAVIALQNRMDQQSYIYQHNAKFAKRRDAEIYAGMAVVVMDTPRAVTIQTADGQTKQVQIMQSITDKETGKPVAINDLTNMEFDVYAEIGPSYATQKEQTLEQIAVMKEGILPQDPLFSILTMKQAELMPGVQMDDIRDYARKDLIMKGVKAPETEEEMQMLAQAQKSQGQPDPAKQIAMLTEQTKNIMAQSSMVKAQNEQANTQIKGFQAQADVANDQAKTEIDMFRAQTDRAAVQVDAQEAGANIEYKRMDTMNKAVDAQLKQADLAEKEMNMRITNMPTDQLIKLLNQ